jgi:hypothetical protein
VVAAAAAATATLPGQRSQRSGRQRQSERTSPRKPRKPKASRSTDGNHPLARTSIRTSSSQDPRPPLTPRALLLDYSPGGVPSAKEYCFHCERNTSSFSSASWSDFCTNCKNHKPRIQ